MKPEPTGYVPKRGRPSLKQAEVIDQTILAAAGEHFLSKGFDGAGMEAIAATAKVSKPTLYSRYPNKYALFKAYLENQFTAWSVESARQDWKRAGTLEARLKYHAETAMVWGLKREVRALDHFIMAGPKSSMEVTRILYETGRNKMIDMMEREIVECTEADDVPARDPRRIALLLLATMMGWYGLESRVRKVSRKEAVDMAHFAVELLIRGRQSW